MKVEFVRVELNNKKTTTAELDGHQQIIADYTAKGYHYTGFVPVLFGPSGKMLTLDLVFECNE